MKAAIELYGERGYEQTTVVEIAKRAGLTERTFFRHFADKREVLFAGMTSLEELLVAAVANAPDGAAPIDAAIAGVEAAGAAIQEGGDLPRLRARIIATSVELQERELVKLSLLASSTARELRRRGVPDPAASLTAEAAIAVFRVAFDRWVNDADEHDLPHLIRASLDELRAVTAGH
ncbi:MAG TPA: helix-turn-helix domain-containing protein [Solirubrobacteraceae bacterium]|nr:helix-turn-helix domain-containing protein [Solirubrobacteraceae bacterium]